MITFLVRPNFSIIVKISFLQGPETNRMKKQGSFLNHFDSNQKISKIGICPNRNRSLGFSEQNLTSIELKEFFDKILLISSNCQIVCAIHIHRHSRIHLRVDSFVPSSIRSQCKSTDKIKRERKLRHTLADTYPKRERENERESKRRRRAKIAKILCDRSSTKCTRVETHTYTE